MSKKGRFDAIFKSEKPATDIEPRAEPKPKANPEPKSEPRPERKATASAKPSAKRETGRGKIPVMRWTQTDNLVTIGAKVPADVALHWAIEAKRGRTSISYIISRALVEALGIPAGALLPEDKSAKADLRKSRKQ